MALTFGVKSPQRGLHGQYISLMVERLHCANNAQLDDHIPVVDLVGMHYTVTTISLLLLYACIVAFGCGELSFSIFEPWYPGSDFQSRFFITIRLGYFVSSLGYFVKQQFF